MSEAELEESEITPNPDIDIDIDENEVISIVESIKEAQYFDASSMGPLTPASVVSIRGILYRSILIKLQGSYRPTKGL